MKKEILLIILILFLTPAMAQKKKQTTEKRLAGIDELLEKVLTTWNAPGFSVAVVEKNKIVYSRGFGFSDYENKIPSTANTLYAIGSCSKAFTSGLLGQLRSENKLSFNDPPRKFIPEFRFFNKEMDNAITLKDLMTHRTGLPRHDLSWYLFNNHSKDSMLMRVAYHEATAGVREAWIYNNFMFLAQGVVAERITGKTWEENVAERIFKPLQMNTSNLCIEDLNKSSNKAFGYETTRENTILKSEYYDIAGMSPAGSINSSANEMANWLIMWINGGKFEGNEVLPSTYVSEAMGSQMVIQPAMPTKENPDVHLANYGYGWMIGSYKGHYRVEHGGNIDGFSATTCFFPSDSIGIVVLVNQNGSSVPSVVRNLIADKMLGLPYTDWNKISKDRRDKSLREEKEAMASKVPDRKIGTQPSHKLAEYAGNYSQPGYGKFEIAVTNDSVFAVTPREKFYLKHYHYDVFIPYQFKHGAFDSTAITQIRFNFQTNDAGDISGIAAKLEAQLDPIIFKRAPAQIKVETSILEKYSGEYELAGMTAKIYLKGENALYLFVPGQPEYELIPSGENKFSIKNLSGFSIEFVETNAVITDVLFIQPNGTFKARKK